MLQWLTGNCRVLGLDGQNWMFAIVGALALYGVVLALLRLRQRT
jgi:hypothetical protein